MDGPSSMFSFKHNLCSILSLTYIPIGLQELTPNALTWVHTTIWVLLKVKAHVLLPHKRLFKI